MAECDYGFLPLASSRGRVPRTVYTSLWCFFPGQACRPTAWLFWLLVFKVELWCYSSWGCSEHSVKYTYNPCGIWLSWAFYVVIARVPRSPGEGVVTWCFNAFAKRDQTLSWGWGGLSPLGSYREGYIASPPCLQDSHLCLISALSRPLLHPHQQQLLFEQMVLSKSQVHPLL